MHMHLNQDTGLFFVAPEVIRTARGADAPAFIALRDPLVVMHGASMAIWNQGFLLLQ